mmetsp:Transcript_31781/g.38406  ORF Transcript_31781/g.38406 Transcript_31781/m.38406 type:complete len:196 (+) Transcript_31781:88-675(+)|eukprot:CAMPEP_0197849914 /NCGR_PEP_ID=MMETSP1438-20131217/13640_1 /TAXON_ID=1461541 /ORGANISM="Pterosperma sp., Strain CCMP1384" /LENGTH=195 /DNA_ID=CAMNT_0043462817 /DNA_START=70 /DNA_END=657 /DNA_ORIENTATION=+
MAAVQGKVTVASKVVSRNQVRGGRTGPNSCLPCSSVSVRSERSAKPVRLFSKVCNRQLSSRIAAQSSDEVDAPVDTSYTGVDPTPERPTETFAVRDTGKWECRSCQYVFDESQGDPEWPVAPGIKFATVEADYSCPVCGAGKDLFESKSTEISGFAENQGYGLGGNTMTSGQKSLLIYGSLLAFFGLFIAGYLLD